MPRIGVIYPRSLVPDYPSRHFLRRLLGYGSLMAWTVAAVLYGFIHTKPGRGNTTGQGNAVHIDIDIDQ
jgi:hypothetical protein